ncbi:dnaJ -like protein [Brachionus plicatilis]|uniref:DnaJ-like protein n=1 Tax=Brachionus plicatilis TaxID=10195 RepID=A0A3M7RSS7_BRAPC|nr:dnaJ -like protein [Brachionus plicatilis]
MSKVKKSLRIKVISIGNSEVGKSCIIKRYCEKRFVAKYLQTIGIDYGVTKVNLNNLELKVNIFDMSGHALFDQIRNEFYKDTQGAILVFDVTDKKSFESLENWIGEIKQELKTNSESIENIAFVVCGNKIDRGKRVVDEGDARIWALSKGFHYFETSASSGAGINEMFETLLTEIVSTFENGGKIKQTNTILSKDQIEAIQRLKNSKDNFERLGLKMGCSKEEINNSFRRLAKLLHPDKNIHPDSTEAFKILMNAKTDLMRNFS